MKPTAQHQKRTTDRINILNIGLMVFSAILAYVWPFYLFLIAYAMLGPLHYLTEISWLHDRSYYTNRKYDYLFLLVAGVVYGGSLLIKYSEPQILSNAIPIAFFASIVFISTKNWYARAALAALAVVLAYAVPVNFTTVILGMLLLTMVHVFLFTGLFILFGAMKSSSRTGYLSLAVFLAMAFVLLFARSMPGGGVADTFVIQHYDHAFGDLNIWLLRVTHFSIAGNYASDPFEFSPGAVAIMRFIAFAYLYHYLNWFSKTKIIRWHEVSKTRLTTVVVLWLAAITVYLIDYDLGLKMLFFLSGLHVLLEFPLDVRTMAGIGTELRKRTRWSRRDLGNIVQEANAA